MPYSHKTTSSTRSYWDARTTPSWQKRHLPGGVRLVQQGEHVAESLADYLKRHPDMDSKCTKNGRTQFFTTENEEKFAESASVFLKTEINVKGIELE